MKRIEVQVGSSTLTYSAPDEVQLNDRVQVSWFEFWRGRSVTEVGRVVSLESSYQGSVKSIDRILPAQE